MDRVSLLTSAPTKARFALAVALIGLGFAAQGAQEREATPAVVNPVLRSPLRQYLNLDGTWDFAIDPDQTGETQKRFLPDAVLSNRVAIRVPGCWEAQGIGGPGNSSSVAPERSIRPLRGSYTGTAWYRKEFTLPSEWAGKQVWLKIGGVHAQGWFWVNGNYVGHNACYCGSYKYNVTDLVRPGERVVVAAKVRNDVPSRKGLMGWIQRFGGLYRSVELDATPSLLIDDAYVVGDLDQRRGVVHVRLRAVGESGNSPVKAEVHVAIATLIGKPAGTGRAATAVKSNSTVDVELPVTLDPFQSWSPEAPNLYRADIMLKLNGKAVDGWCERFGVRKWEVRDGRFYLNNKPYFVRGYGDDFVYPLTIVSPASRELHRQHLQVAKAYGFAYVRHHTHCELPEFYEAADELGIMVQPELPYYGTAPSAAAPAFFKPREDLEELYRHYRRHVSLSTYCTGNEGHLGSPIDREVYQLAKRLDPTRLALHQDGGQNRKDNSDFHQGPTVPWEPGTQDASWPFTAHEYLNLATQEDPRLAGKYTGAILPPVTVEDFRAELARAGLSWEWGLATLDAGNQLQRICQKRGLEQARLDPACDGYIYWTIVDVGSPSAQGLLNQFWEPKASTAQYFRQFNSPTVILAKFAPKERILRAGEDWAVEWWISNFDPAPGANQPLRWRLEQNEKTLASGTVPPQLVDPGEVKSIGNTNIRMPEVANPAKFRLVAELAGAGVTNSWDLWIFPNRTAAADSGKGMCASTRLYSFLKNQYPRLAQMGTPQAEACPLWVTDRYDTNTVAALREGKNVLLLNLPGAAPGVELGWWAISKQAGTAIARHPAFGDFPHEGFLNELEFRLSGRAPGIAEHQSLRDVEPLMVTRGGAGYLVSVFQAKAGAGKLLASGLNLLSEHPEAIHLLQQFIRYANSREFQPKGTLDPDSALKDLRFPYGNFNGWSQTLHASERWEYDSFLGRAQMCIARQTDGASKATWRTEPVSSQLNRAEPYAFTWAAGLGYISQPAGKFTLFLNQKPLLEFDVVHNNSTWRSADGAVTLKYDVKSAGGEDSSGVMTLSVPGALLKPGASAELHVVGSATNSRRWFGLYEIEPATLCTNAWQQGPGLR